MLSPVLYPTSHLDADGWNGEVDQMVQDRAMPEAHSAPDPSVPHMESNARSLDELPSPSAKSPAPSDAGDLPPPHTLAQIILPYLQHNPSSSLNPKIHSLIANRNCLICQHANGLGRDRRSAERHFATACVGAKAANAFVGTGELPGRRDVVLGLHVMIALKLAAGSSNGDETQTSLTIAEREFLEMFPSPHLEFEGQGGDEDLTQLISGEGGGLDGRLDWWEIFEDWARRSVSFCSFGCGFHSLRDSSVKRHEP